MVGQGTQSWRSCAESWCNLSFPLLELRDSFADAVLLLMEDDRCFLGLYGPDILGWSAISGPKAWNEDGETPLLVQGRVCPSYGRC